LRGPSRVPVAQVQAHLANSRWRTASDGDVRVIEVRCDSSRGPRSARRTDASAVLSALCETTLPWGPGGTARTERVPLDKQGVRSIRSYRPGGQQIALLRPRQRRLRIDVKLPRPPST